MSKQPYDGYILNVVRLYPRLMDKLEEKRAAAMSLTASTTGGDHAPGKPTERAALVTLCEKEQRWLEAVGGAIQVTRRLKDGAERLKLIDALFWSRTHTMHGAAELLHISYRTAQRRRGAFLELVEKNLNL